MLLTIKQLGTELGIKPSTLYAWVVQGKIPCLKIHGLVRFNADEIARWIETFKPQAPAPAVKSRGRSPQTPLDELVARAKRHAYNSRPRGNQR